MSTCHWYHGTSADYAKWRGGEPDAMASDKWRDECGADSGTMSDNNNSVPIAIHTCTATENI